MNDLHRQSGFSLIELLVAATVFTFVVTGVAGLFVQALDIQRRATGIQKIEENAQFVIESVAREVRVSQVMTPDTNCNPPDPLLTSQLIIKHPVNGTITYKYDRGSGIGVITRDPGDGSGPQPITTADVDFKSFAFCVKGATADGLQARVTMPMTLQITGGRPSTRVSVSLQTTVSSRDLVTDLNR